MRIEVRHLTRFRFAEPASYSIHQCRLTPRPGEGQRIVQWEVRTPGRPRDWHDGYGNALRSFAVTEPHREIEVLVHGVFESIEGSSAYLRADEPESLPPGYWLANRGLARHDEAIAGFVGDLAGRAGDANDLVPLLHALMTRIAGHIEYRWGVTDVGVGAAEVLARRAGVCQDHAHLFIACCRAIGVPARYVSGYLRVHDQLHAGMGSHAWAEAYVPHLGWLGFDAANGICPTGDYLKLAVGLDYTEAAPITGRRVGGADAGMDVEVAVRVVG